MHNPSFKDELEFKYCFSRAVKRLREAKGFSQHDMAKTVGVTQPALSQYESCSRSPEIYPFYKIAKALGITMDKLLKEMEKEHV